MVAVAPMLVEGESQGGPTRVEGEVGGKARLQCAHCSHPPPTVTWYTRHSSVPLHPSARLLVVNEVQQVRRVGDVLGTC